MSRERFLLHMLAFIFAFQGTMFTYHAYICHIEGGWNTCPELNEQYEDTFAVMVSTTLALLTGSNLKG